MEALLSFEGVQTHFETPLGMVRAVDGATFTVRAGEILGLAGESGCGKTIALLSIPRLIPPPGLIVGGRVLFSGRDLLALPEDEMRRLRGSEIGVIFQDPGLALDPVYRVNALVEEALRAHDGHRPVAREARRLLECVGLPRNRVDSYPHELSGGMRQRVMIAIAIANRPRLLLADEPTTALDVIAQAQIVAELRRLRDELDAGVILVSHNLHLLSQVADRLAIMYLGRVLESGPTAKLLCWPRHPYTAHLAASTPRLGQRGRLVPVPGQPTPLTAIPSGCRFHPRCRWRIDDCYRLDPPLEPSADGERWVACLRASSPLLRRELADLCRKLDVTQERDGVPARVGRG